MTKLRKIILVLAAAVVALVVVVIFGRNLIIKSSVPPAVKAVTGFDASLADVDVGLFSSKIAIKELKVTNPDDFTEKRMLHAPEIYLEYKLGSMMSNRREFPVLRLNVSEVVVVKTEKGESNVKRIMEAKPKSEGPSAANHFGEADVTIGKVVLIDFSKMVRGKPLTVEYTLNFHQKFTDVADDDLKKLVMLPALKSFAGKIQDIKPETLEKGMKNVVNVGMGVATNTLATGMGPASNVTGKVTEAFKGLDGLFGSKTNAPSKGK